MTMRESIRTKRQWLKARKNRGIGASEAAAIVNLSPYMSSSELWDIKVGNTKPKDISKNEYVSLGVRCEPILRNLFKAVHTDITIEHHAYDLLYQEERPWLFATLDGEIIDGDRRGILEIKTSTPSGKQGWIKWDNRIPENYYIQVLHQMLATGYDFAILEACLFSLNGDKYIREYRFEREECKEDLEWLLKEEEKFWGWVKDKKMPSTLTLVL